MYTAEDLRRDYLDMNPSKGKCPPIEAVWKMNTMTYAEFQEQLAKQREDARAYRNLKEGERISAQAQALQRECERAGMPHRFSGCPTDATYADHLNAGGNLWIWGQVGTGKTVEACAVLKDWLKRGRPGRMVSTVALLTELRAAMDGQGRELDYIARYSTVPLLVLDDLGQEVPSEWALSRLFEIVDRRYNAGLPVIVTSNLAPFSVAERLHADAMVSRLMERCEVRKVEGEDRRIS